MAGRTMTQRGDRGNEGNACEARTVWRNAVYRTSVSLSERYIHFFMSREARRKNETKNDDGKQPKDSDGAIHRHML